ncbi:MAG: hypothetical protein EP346_10020 [Bacteroidetes bacterium]|nr:MAG: hypothetical protein EP346_10020 [Bacteroidota bacterium]
MKKTILLLVLLCSASAFAQYPRWYMQFQLGYGHDLNTQQPGLTNWISTSIDDNGDYSETQEYYSYANGPKLTFSMGAEVARGIAIEGQLMYSYGIADQIDQTNFFSDLKATTGGQFVGFSPMVRLQNEIRNWEETYVYLRVGPLFSMNSTYLLSEYAGSESRYKLETDWSFDVGAQGSLGLMFPVSRYTHFTVEGQFVYLMSKPSHAEYTEYEEWGEDRLGDLTTRQRERVYRRTVDYNNTNDDEPMEMVEIQSPFSHFALNLGLRFEL